MSEALVISAPLSWYLSPKGKIEGPFSDEDIVAKLLGRTISPSTLACPDGGAAWHPLVEWSAFSNVVAHLPQLASHLPPAPNAKPKLVIMDRIVLWYALGANPFMILMGTLTFCIVLGSSDSNGPLIGTKFWIYIGFWIGRTVARGWIATAGIKLWRRSPTWPVTMSHGLWGILLFTVGYLPILYAVVTLVAVLERQGAPAPPNSDGENVMMGIIILTDLAELAFLIVGLVWLGRRSRVLAGSGGQNGK